MFTAAGPPAKMVVSVRIWVVMLQNCLVDAWLASRGPAVRPTWMTA